MENNNEPPITNYQPEIQMPSPDVPSPEQKKNKLKLPFIFLTVLTVGSLTFGIFEFIQNSNLKSEIADLKSKIETPEKPEEPKEENHNIYSGTLEYIYSTYGDEDGEPILADTPEQKYTVKLNFDTGELYVKHESIGNCPNMNCGESEDTLSLTEKELKKIWWIKSSEGYEDIYVSSVFTASLIPNKGDNLKTVLTRMIKNDSEMMSKVGITDENWAEIADYDTDENGIFTFREYANYILDEILFGLYGWINCMPPMFEYSCAEDSDCEATEVRETSSYNPSTLNCYTAKEINYPYIAY